MKWSGGGRNQAIADGANVIGVDVHPDTNVVFPVDAEVRSRAANRFGQRDRRATVKPAEWLFGSLIDWHRGRDRIVGYERENDVQVLDHTVAATVIDLLQGKGLMPDDAV